MPEWVVVLLALAAAVTSALGIVIRQRATLEIPQDEGVSATMFKKLLRNRLWWAGTAVAASGYGFQALALTWGSLILVAPLLVSALLFALPMSARLAHRRVTTHDWVWALVLTFGLAIFLTIARVQPGNYQPPPAVWILATALCVAVVAACVIGGARTEGRNRALLIATAVGVLFGVVSVLTKVTVQRLNEEGPLATLLVPAPYLVLILGVAATLLQQSAFHAGALQASVPTMLVLEPLVAVSLGVIVLGEALAVSDPVKIGLLAVAVGAMGAATIALGRDEGAFEEMLEAEMAKRESQT
ncbi:DMT family transporter [Mycolicibacterium stellerae]|uniref:DMT family transporter n=1 Tax=Mycolicibacterium stellerae TaxID=2358193 RepID=UPI000F0BBFE0|nr:DMT family transporter [Mycolicibacterium stellerae]